MQRQCFSASQLKFLPVVYDIESCVMTFVLVTMYIRVIIKRIQNNFLETKVTYVCLHLHGSTNIILSRKHIHDMLTICTERKKIIAHLAHNVPPFIQDTSAMV